MRCKWKGNFSLSLCHSLFQNVFKIFRKVSELSILWLFVWHVRYTNGSRGYTQLREVKNIAEGLRTAKSCETDVDSLLNQSITEKKNRRDTHSN